MSEEIRAGSHTALREDAFLVVYEFRGRLEGHELKVLSDQHRAWVSGLPFFLVLCDATDLEHVSPEALAEAQLWGDIEVPRAFAFITRRFVIRAAIDTMTRAIRFGWDRPLEARSFRDTESARQWLEERRQVYAASAVVARP